MSVTNVALAWAGSTGSSTKQGREYTATYRVETDTHLDQTKTIVDFFRDNARFNDLALPYLDSSYSFANDVDPVALCDSIAPKRAENSQQHWSVEFHYKTPDEEEEETGETENGEASNNPLDWRMTCDVSFVDYTRPVTKAIYRGGFAHNFLDVGEEYAVVNSSFAVLDPPLERSAMQQLYRFGYYRNTYPGWVDQAFRAVNRNPFRIQIRDPNTVDERGQPDGEGAILDSTFLDFTCQISSVNGAIVRKNGLTLWRMSTEMLVDNEFGFRVDVLDQGVTAIGGDNYPDGMGGNFVEANWAAGTPAQRRIMDPNGMPITEPILLNGNGQPLKLGDPPVYVTWSIYPETDFRILNDFIPVVLD